MCCTQSYCYYSVDKLLINTPEDNNYKRVTLRLCFTQSYHKNSAYKYTQGTCLVLMDRVDTTTTTSHQQM